MAPASRADSTAEAMSSWPADASAFRGFLLPRYWLMITAPPEDRAVKRKTSTVLKELTRDTPDTSASQAKLTTKVSAMPTSISRNCSTKRGTIRSLRSRLENMEVASGSRVILILQQE